MSIPTTPPGPMAAYDGPTSLANQLHGYPHYDFARHQVQVNASSVVHNPGPYLESLGSIAAVPMILFLIYSLFELIVRLYFACRTPRIDEQSAMYKPKMYICCSRYQPYWDKKWAVAMVFATMCLITVFVALGFLGSVNKDLNKAEDAMYDARGYENNLVKDGYDAIAIINSVFNILQHLGSGDNPPYNRVGQSQLQQTLVQVQSSVEQAAQTLGSFIGTSNSYRFANDLIHYTDMGRNDLRAVMITVFLTFFFTFIPILMIRSFLATKRTCLNLFQILGLIACFISWCAAMVMIAISVGVADLCQDPNGYITEYFRNSSPDTQLTIQYYIRCPAATQMPVPLYNNLKDAQSKTNEINTILSAAISTIQSQNGMLPDDVKNLVQQIYTTNQQANTLLLNVIVDTGCTRLYNDYTIAVNTICKDALSHWYAVAVCIAVFTLLYVFTRCFIRSRQRIISTDIEGDGNMVFTKVDTPPQQPQHVIEMNTIQQSSAPMIAPTSFEQPLASAPTQSFQQPLEPARTSFQQPLAPAPAPTTFDGPLVPPHAMTAASAPPQESGV